MNSSIPKITVVVPTRNRALKLKRCLESLATQTLTDFAIIVVNDGATDNTMEILETFRAMHPSSQLKVIQHHIPRGANPSRNEAIDTSLSPWIAFLDDDCFAEPNWLQELKEQVIECETPAVTGHVENIALSNQWERFFIGQHRVVSRVTQGIRVARRLVAGNAMVHRDWLINTLDEDRACVSDDLTTSARGDEEGLRIRIERADLRIVHAPDAIVYHDHPYTLNSFCRQAFKSGRATARLTLKYRLPPRCELCALLIAVVMLPLSASSRLVAYTALAFFGLFLLAALFNEWRLKGKSAMQIASTLPAMFLYYILRTTGYSIEFVSCVKSLPNSCKRLLAKVPLVRLIYRIREESRFFSQHPEWNHYRDRWRESRRHGRSALADRQPWLTFSAIDWLEARCFNGMKVFEWGSGGSTLFWADRGAIVTSIEHDLSWAERVKNELEDSPAVNHFWIPSQRDNYLNYVDVICDFPDEYFDLILIDGRAREACLKAAISKIHRGGVILLDNADRSRYAQGIEVLRSSLMKNWKEIVFDGPTPYFWGSCATTIAWVRPE